MAAKPTQIIILCEDQSQEFFIRHFFQTYLSLPRKCAHYFNPIISPPGQGAGEQFVRQTFVNEVKAYRKRKNSIKIALVLMIDADTHEATQRRQQMEAALQEEGLPPLSPEEAVLIFIPKRNIETWARFLFSSPSTPPPDEDRDYKKQVPPIGDWKKPLQDLGTHCREHSPLPDSAPPSLRAACPELDRLASLKD
jgi:hypothetical protein